MKLLNEVALITGSSRGIGKEIAFRFAAEGAKVVINGVNEDGVNIVVRELTDKGYKAYACAFDTADREAVKHSINKVTAQSGKISILVNNAGISPKKNGKKSLIKDMTYEEWTRVIDVNLNGVFNCCQAVIEDMIKAKRGKIINISSAFARYYSDLATSHYVTTKAAVIGFTHALCGELAQYGINCNAIAPGRAWTDLTKLAPKELNDAFMETIPMKRFASTSDIANVALFLASDASAYINGATIDVNGGVYMN